MIRLLTSFYSGSGLQRRAELLECLERNLALTQIDQVCMLLEETATPVAEQAKLITRPIAVRPKYSDFFHWANELVEADSDVTVIANSDIWFDDSISFLARSLHAGQCAALARWDLQSDGSLRLFDVSYSQDVWVFRGSIRPVDSDFPTGIARCDNRILSQLQAAGYEVINPALTVRAIHLHRGECRHYPVDYSGPQVEPPYAYLRPHALSVAAF